MAALKMNPKISIIIANWNGKEYLKDCLDSVFGQSYTNFGVVVVDNGSTDGSVEFIKENYPKVEIIALENNMGFARANNIAMQKALSDGAEYIALLNNDTKAEKNYLIELLKVISSDSKTGICASKMLRMDDPGLLDSTGHIFPDGVGIIADRGSGEADAGQYDDKPEVIGACAGACLYSRRMLEEIGLFDESFGSYYEDAELSWRAHNAGWKAKYAPAAVVYHKRHGTRGKHKELEKEIKDRIILNIARTIRRHATIKQKIRINLIWIKGALLQEFNSVFSGEINEPDYIKRLKLLWFGKS